MIFSFKVKMVRTKILCSSSETSPGIHNTKPSNTQTHYTLINFIYLQNECIFLFFSLSQARLIYMSFQGNLDATLNVANIVCDIILQITYLGCFCFLLSLNTLYIDMYTQATSLYRTKN